eukprot:scaffold432171_cov228-Attheya_sp.AAC.1
MRRMADDTTHDTTRHDTIRTIDEVGLCSRSRSDEDQSILCSIMLTTDRRPSISAADRRTSNEQYNTDAANDRRSRSVQPIR